MKSCLKSKPTRDAYVDIKAMHFKINKIKFSAYAEYLGPRRVFPAEISPGEACLFLL